MTAVIWLVAGGLAVALINALSRRLHQEPDRVSNAWLKARWFEESILRDRRM